MKDFIEELKYMCTSSNAKGFYIFVSIMLVVLLIAIPVMLIMFIVNTVKYGFTPLFLILTLVALAIFIGIVVWLKKS